MKKAIIYDLDNTIYSVPEVGEAMLAPLFELVARYYPEPAQLAHLKHELMHVPFQVVATRHHFPDDLTSLGIQLLEQLTYEGPLATFPDYPAVRLLAPVRYLVTTGFTAFQRSKITGLGIEADFAEIHIADPTQSSRTKQDVFADILARHGYAPAEVLVVGDDPNSEIKAAHALGIETVLYHPGRAVAPGAATYAITSFEALAALLKPAA